MPVIPLALRDLGSSFPSSDAPAARRPPRQRGMFGGVELVAGAALTPPEVSVERVRDRVALLLEP